MITRVALSVPSTSGLRDETESLGVGSGESVVVFQYPQPRVYAMKHNKQVTHADGADPFSTLNLGSTR